MKRILNVLLLLSLIVLISCETESVSTVEVTQDEVKAEKILTIGVVPQFSSKRILSIWSPIIESLEATTGYQIQIIGTPSIPAFEAELSKGTYDIAYCNPYHSVVANSQQGYEAILFDGSKKLFGVLAVKNDDDIKDIKELDGSTIAFPAPNALGASLLMRTELSQMHNIDIQPDYVKTHTNVYLSVVEGKTRAGGGVMRTFNELSDDIKNQLRIFYTTQKVPSHPIVVHPRLEADLVKQITTALLEMGSTEEGNAMLSKIPLKNITKTKQSAYDLLKNMGMEDFYMKSN